MKKLCPICDAKIHGRYCKECRRFVTPYEISDHAYINENHFQSDIPHNNCDYHDVKPKQYTASVPNKPRVEKKKSGCSGAIVVIIVMIIMFSTCVLPLIGEIFGAIFTDTYEDYDDTYNEQDFTKEAITETPTYPLLEDVTEKATGATTSNKQEEPTSKGNGVKVSDVESLYKKVTNKEPVITESSSETNYYAMYGDGYFTVIVRTNGNKNSSVKEITLTASELSYIPNMIKEVLTLVTKENTDYNDSAIESMYSLVVERYTKDSNWNENGKNINYYDIALVRNVRYSTGSYYVTIKITE